jgi:hypothetical protein
MLGAAGYCGLFLGKTTDKSSLFDIISGELGDAPMISQCPLFMECEGCDAVDHRSGYKPMMVTLSLIPSAILVFPWIEKRI